MHDARKVQQRPLWTIFGKDGDKAHFPFSWNFTVGGEIERADGGAECINLLLRLPVGDILDCS